MSHLIKELCTLAGTKNSRTTPYHSMGNGMTEIFNRMLLEMLGTLEPEKKENGKAHVGPLVHAYNCHSPQLDIPITTFSNVWKTTKITH